MGKTLKRFLSMAVAIFMVISMMPTNFAFATEADDPNADDPVTETTQPEASEPEAQDAGPSVVDGVLDVTGATGPIIVCPEGYWLNNTLDNQMISAPIHTITGTTDFNICFNGPKYDGAYTLKDLTVDTTKGEAAYGGIEIPSSNCTNITLTIEGNVTVNSIDRGGISAPQVNLELNGSGNLSLTGPGAVKFENLWIKDYDGNIEITTTGDASALESGGNGISNTCKNVTVKRTVASEKPIIFAVCAGEPITVIDNGVSSTFPVSETKKWYFDNTKAEMELVTTNVWSPYSNYYVDENLVHRNFEWQCVTGNIYSLEVPADAQGFWLAGQLIGGDGENNFLSDYTVGEYGTLENMVWTTYTENTASTAVAEVNGVQYESLQAAVDAATDGATVKVIDDFTLDSMVTIPNGVTITLDLNGKTVTGTDTTTKNFSLIDNRGTLTITDSSDAQTGKMTLTATTNSGWLRYSAVIANNPGGKLTIESGTFEHLGGTDMAYGIDNLTNGKGTYAETIINGGTIKSTYRGIRQFLNGVEAQNILTINGGTIEGANKSVWMQDPNKNANTGSLTVGENAKLNGDVYLFVTAGSTEWPVEIAINNAALSADSEIITANVPYNKTVEMNDTGVWGVAARTKLNGEGTSAAPYVIENLNDLLFFRDLANSGNKFSGKYVKVTADIDLGGMTWTPIKNFLGTFDGGDHTISNYHLDATNGHAGFFYKLDFGNGTAIKDLTLSDITATVGNYYVGALAYFSFAVQDNITIKNFTVTTTASEANIGGYAGWVEWGHIRNCTIENMTVNAENGAGLIGGLAAVLKADNWLQYNNIDVKGFKVTINDTDSIYAEVGGLVGQTQTGHDAPVFTNCDITGIDVTATGLVTVGGFIARPGSHTTAKNCTTEGKIDVTGVTSANESAGGFFGNLGWNNNESSRGGHKLTNCTADVDIITKIAPAGGFVGAATNEQNRNMAAAFTDCSASGDITVVEDGTANVGGFAGDADRGTYTNCSASGTITNNGSGYAGQFLGAAEKLMAMNLTNCTYTGASTELSFIGTTAEGADVTVKKYVAKIGETSYFSLAEALTAAEDGATITLIWEDGDDPIAMNGAVYGKTVTITGTATVDWSKGFLFVGRGGAGNGTVIFDGANLTSASNTASYGIHVSGREKDAEDKYDGTLVIKDSTIELDYLINKGTMTLDNATLTVKNGFSIGGRPASETESGEDATATLDLTNGSKVVVDNHNGMGLGYEAIGVMNVDKTSSFETTQSFLVTDKGTLNLAGTATIAGTLTNNGSIVLTDVAATLTSSECGKVTTNVDNYGAEYVGGVYTVVRTSLNGEGTEAEPFVIENLEDLKFFRDLVNTGTTFKDQYIKLTANINLAGENWVPIGNDTNYFRGHFDGGNNTISNMTIESTSTGNQFAGLFGGIKNGTVKNLTMKNVNINVVGAKVRAAAIVGIASSDTTTPAVLALNFENITIDGCSITVEATSGSAMAGGIAGYCYPANMKGITVEDLTINGKAAGNTLYASPMAAYVCGQNISNNGNTRMAFTVEDFALKNIDIKAEANSVLAGGYTGEPYYGYITFNNGTIDGIKMDVDAHEAFVGGLVGYFWRSDNGHKVNNVNITGIDFDVTTDYLGETRIGGMVGTSQSVVAYKDCSVAGTITERCSDSANPVNYHAKVGGFVGRAYTWAQTYENCVADVDVTGSHVAGGFVGNHITNAKYTNCEAKGDVTANIAGGFAGRLTENGFSTAVTFDSCSASGAVDGTKTAGGFIGSTADYGWGGTTGNPYAKTITLTDCVASDTVTGDGNVAGVVGELLLKDGIQLVMDGVDYTVNPAYLPEDADVKTYVAMVNGEGYFTLQEALNAAAAGTGNVTVEILDDVDLTGVVWEPVTVSDPGYPVVTVNGNNKTITGLTDMLFAGTWAGKSGLIINDLTIEDSTIVNDKEDTKGTVGVGAFIGYPQASATITLNNCHLVNSTVEGGHWTGGLIGMAGGYNGNDGPVFMNLTITGCSVTGSTITGKGSAGGIIGHSSCAAWTNVVIEDTTVSGNTITSTGSATNKAGSVMGTIGAAGQPTSANGVTKQGGTFVSATVSGNTVTSGGKTIDTIYGRQGSATGALELTGGSYDEYPIEDNVAYATVTEGYELKRVDGMYEVVAKPVASVAGTNYFNLQDAIDAAIASGETVFLLRDVECGAVTVNGTVTIDLKGYTLTGSILAPNAELTIKNGSIVNPNASVSALEINAGKLKLTNVNMDSARHALRIDGAVEATINGGTYRGAIGTGTGTYHAVNVSGAANVTIKDGTFVGPKGTTADSGAAVNVQAGATVTIEGGNFSAGKNNTLAAKGTLTVYGGSYDQDPKAFLTYGYCAVLADGVYTVTEAVAYVGEVGYPTIKAAMDAAQAGDTVTILAGDYTMNLDVKKAITVVGETDADGKNLVNFNGKLNITADGAAVKNLNFNNGSSRGGYINAKDVLVEGCTVVGGNGFRSCYTKGTVTFKDSTITGSVYGIHFDGSAGGNIVIDNCVITGWTSFASTITNVAIEDTTFEKGNYNQLRFYQNAQLTNVEFNENMNIDFGKDEVKADFDGCTVADGSSLLDVIYLPDLDEMGINVTVDDVPIVLVAKIGDEYYLSLTDALAAVQTDETITLLKDYEVKAGETLQIAGFKLATKDGVKLTNNGTIEVSGTSDIAATVTGSGWVYMNGVTLSEATKLLGAKVRFASGTNNVDGSIIDDGFFQVGIGAYEGEDTNVDTANGVVVNVKDGAKIGSSGSTYAGWIGTGYYDTDAEKAAAMNDAKYVLNIENSIAEFGYLHVSNDGVLNVTGNAAEKVHYNTSEYSFYAGDFIINGEATMKDTDVLALYTKVSCDNGTDKPGTLNITGTTEYEAERHNGAIAGTNFELRKTGVVNVGENATLHVGEPASIAANAVLNVAGTATVLGDITNNGTINITHKAATITTPADVTVVTKVDNTIVSYVDGTYKLIDAVAKIGDTYYATIQAAIAAAKNDDTITLTADLVNVGDAFVSGKTVTIDGDGHMVTGRSRLGASYYSTTGDITFKNINFKDITPGEKWSAITINHLSGTATIDNCTFTNVEWDDIQVASNKTGAKVVITNNTFDGSGARGIHIQPTTAENAVMDITITGNKFYHNDAANATSIGVWFPSAESELTIEKNYVEDPATISISLLDEGVNTNYSELALPLYNEELTEEIKYVAKVESGVYDTNFYTTLADAIAAAAAGDTIMLLEDVALTAPLTIEADDEITLDLNGKTLSYVGNVQNEAMITNKGNLTIDDTSDAENGKILYTYTGAADGSYGKGNYAIANRGSLTVEAGMVQIEAKDVTGKFGHALYAIDNYSGSDLTVNGGKVYNANNIAIRAFGAVDIEVTGGEIEGLRAIWLQLPSSDKTVAPVVNLTVTGGTLTGTGIGESSDNKLAIYSYSYGNDMKNVTIDISGGTFNGDIALTGGSNKTNIETVEITGGTFNGKYGDVYSYGADEKAIEAITITGGTFATTDAEMYALDDKYQFVANSEGKYEAEAYTNVAEVNGVGYETLQAAVNAAGKDGEVKLLVNGQSANISDAMTIVKNGKTAELYVKNGLSIVEAEESYKIVAEAVVSGEAAIGTTIYKTLADAITAANAMTEPAFINLLTNITTQPNVTITNEMTFIAFGCNLWDADAATAMKAITGTGYDVTVNGSIIFVTEKPVAQAPVATINGVEYATVEAALAAAKSGETVVMVADSDESTKHLRINAGVILNLDKYTLKVASLTGGKDTAVTAELYTSGGNYGKLYADDLSLQEAPTVNSQNRRVVPFWDDEAKCYVFAYFEFYDEGYNNGALKVDKESKTIKFMFAHRVASAMNKDFLGDGTSDNKMKIIVRAHWMDGEDTVDMDFTYKDTFVSKVANDNSMWYAFYLTGYDLVGVDLENFEIQAMVITDSGVVSTGTLFKGTEAVETTLERS